MRLNVSRGRTCPLIYLEIVDEIGPLSEASIGNIQAFFPQQGFVDQVAIGSSSLRNSTARRNAD